jgi:hypothetical protein
MTSVTPSPKVPSGNCGRQTKLFKDRFRESFGDVFLVILAKFREKDCFIYFVKTNDGPLCLLGLLVR